jgi:hypothetical protein
MHVTGMDDNQHPTGVTEAVKFINPLVDSLWRKADESTTLGPGKDTTDPTEVRIKCPALLNEGSRCIICTSTLASLPNPYFEICPVRRSPIFVSFEFKKGVHNKN